MEATIVDLRYKMNDVMKALNRNEDVKILYRGNVKGVIKPNCNSVKKSVMEHPFFNMDKSDTTVETTMNKLRAGRYDDI